MNQSYEKSLKDDNFWLSKYLKYKKKYMALKEYIGGGRVKQQLKQQPRRYTHRSNTNVDSNPKIVDLKPITEFKIPITEFKIPITKLYPIIIVTAHGSIKYNTRHFNLLPGVTMIKSLPGVQMRDDLCPNILNGIRKLLEKNEGNINTKTILTGINLIYNRSFLGAEYKGGELYSDLNLSLLDPTEQQQTGLQIKILFYNSEVIEHTIDGLSKPVDFDGIYKWIRAKKKTALQEHMNSSNSANKDVMLSDLIEYFKSVFSGFYLLVNSCSGVVDQSDQNIFGQEDIQQLKLYKMARDPFAKWRKIIRYLREKLARKNPPYYNKYLTDL